MSALRGLGVAGGGAPSLDRATFSPARHGRVRATVYPSAGEVVLSPLDGRRDVDRTRKRHGPTDATCCRREASKRAARELRRFCKAHRLCFMWTLTYGDGGQRDASQLRRHIERLIAKIAAERNGNSFPYVYAIEPHADGERLHVHIAVPFFFDHARLGALWGRGFVWCSDKRQHGECAHVGATRAASYLAKYVAKTFGESDFGRHRYEVAKGWRYERYQVRCRNFGDGRRYAEAVFMAAPEYVWDSRGCEDWWGPPVQVLFFVPRADDG